jgi:hypothetical protein
MCEGRVSGCNKCYGCEGDGGSYESCMQLCAQSTCDPECRASDCETCIDGLCVMKCRTDLCYVCNGSGRCVFNCAAGETCCNGSCVNLNNWVYPAVQNTECGLDETQCRNAEINFTGCCPQPNWVCCKGFGVTEKYCAATACDCPDL